MNGLIWHWFEQHSSFTGIKPQILGNGKRICFKVIKHTIKTFKYTCLA